jgi:hypothetical protein
VTAPGARIDRILGDGPFREIGLPRVTATSPDRLLIAVGGTHVAPRRHGRPAGPWSHPVAVYGTGDLTCRFLTGTRWPVNALAFHPTRPLLAIGTGAHDGGYLHQGELLLLDLDGGATVSLIEHPRAVRRITWRDPQTLDLVLAVVCDGDVSDAGGTSLACTLHRDDWYRPAAGSPPAGETPHPDVPDPDPADAVAAVQRLSPGWAPRRAVWAVEGPRRRPCPRHAGRRRRGVLDTAIRRSGLAGSGRRHRLPGEPAAAREHRPRTDPDVSHPRRPPLEARTERRPGDRPR